MTDERVQKLRRRWRETGDPEDGWAYVRARLYAEDLLFELLLRVIRLEQRGSPSVMYQRPVLSPADVVRWLDRREPPPSPPPQPGLLNVELNRGYQLDWLTVPCLECHHERGRHGPDPERRRECVLCDCTRGSYTDGQGG